MSCEGPPGGAGFSKGVWFKLLRVGIIGSSGYAGAELLRLLGFHSEARVTYIGSHSHVGKPVSEILPAFFNRSELVFSEINPELISDKCDLLFTATPSGVSMELARPVVESGVKLIDIGADFRLKDAGLFQRWYGMNHTCSDLLAEAVYGLPEVNGERIAGARIVANPGCYPTSVLLGLAPLIANELVKLSDIVVTSMSGVSGAGATPGAMYHFPECAENLRPYGVAGHRHLPEIEQEIASLAGGIEPRISFTPHLVPMSRGLLSTMILSPSSGAPEWAMDERKLRGVYLEFYEKSHFVRILDQGKWPQTKAVYGSNFCDIAIKPDARAGKIVVCSAIDNLGKGAAGQAIQNMNLMMGISETEGLLGTGLLP